MELPDDKLERALVALLMAAVLATAWAESRSSLAQAVRAGRPWLFWLAVAEKREGVAPRLTLGLYRPDRRTVDLILVPGATLIAGERTLEQVYEGFLKEDGSEKEAARQTAEAASAALAPDLPSIGLADSAFLYAENVSPAAASPDEAALFDAENWLEARVAGVGFWRSLFSPRELPRLRLLAEFKRLRPEGIRPAELPPAPLRREFLARLLSQEPLAPPGETPIVVEVLNASDAKGIASQAAKILRLAGADVVSVGNAAPEDRASRTVVYDRSGRVENAFWVRARLNCPRARVATRLRERRLADATVVLAGDCRF